LSRRTLAKGISGVAAVGVLARHADSALAQATPGAGPAVATAESVAAAIDQLESLITGAMADTGVPGLSIAVVFQDEVVYARGFGVRSVDAADPVDKETVFQLASVSKSLASSTVSTLVTTGEVT